jgi:hypothetical protein
MRLNHWILPLNTIRGGACGTSTIGRIDGMCVLEDFITSQQDITAMANYDYSCFGNYTIGNATSGKDCDGASFQ